MRRRFKINGTVQGVGFRPFVYRIASESKLAGFISNTDTGVVIEAQGSDSYLNTFQEDLIKKAPPLSEIKDLLVAEIPENGDRIFSIVPTVRNRQNITTAISPDVATCPDCLNDISSRTNRRTGYPFTNCTNCGPRYSIISRMPYDRPFTVMKKFTMCDACLEEYENPLDRRFHAQPNACPDCGPELSLTDSSGKKIESDDPIKQTVQLLKEGRIVAVKGLGGFHLAVDACHEEAVVTLRERKHREEKPLALMVKNQAVAERFCRIIHEEAGLLTSYQSPIVLLDKLDNVHLIAPSVAPGSRQFGIMLPYTPLHHLLFNQDIDVLVMTSANLSEEPICIDNAEALERLEGIADYFLFHDRDILIRSDDSITAFSGGQMRILRRSRGYVPRPFYIGTNGASALGTGAELKNTFCFLNGDQAIMSQHIGDLENMKAIEFFREIESHLKGMYRFSPDIIVHDLHPSFYTTTWASESGLPTLGVQHHHAHMASVITEHGLDQPVVGLILDGTGLGTDHTIWGGEILTGDLQQFRRFAAFENFLIPGGDSAIREPWKLAVSCLFKAFGSAGIPELPFLKDHPWKPVIEMLEKEINTIPTSSAGRLFDAVAALAGGRQKISYEAQTAIEFMNSSTSTDVKPYTSEILETDGLYRLTSSPMIIEITQDVMNGYSVGHISDRFHRTMIHMLVNIAEKACRETGLTDVVINGGVFQNRILLNGLVTELTKRNITGYIPEKFPMNDGGISLGQAMMGREYLKNRT